MALGADGSLVFRGRVPDAALASAGAPPAGGTMNELLAAPSPKAGEQQIELPLASFPPGEYVIEIKAFFQDTATTELYTLSLHDALPISSTPSRATMRACGAASCRSFACA